MLTTQAFKSWLMTELLNADEEEVEEESESTP
jgi:hypothetical protein